jgi:hypothetical protein
MRLPIADEAGRGLLPTAEALHGHVVRKSAFAAQAAGDAA